MQLDSNHAIAYGKNGQRYVDMTIQSENGYLKKSSTAPMNSCSDRLSHRLSQVARKNFKDIYFDSVSACLPGSKAVLTDDWNEFNDNFFQNSKNITNNLSIRTVDVFGIRGSNEIKFIFRKVEDQIIAEHIQDQLNKNVPSINELINRVNEAIELSQFPTTDNRAAQKYLNPITFYYLPVGKLLQATLETGETINVESKNKPLIFAYPIHPDMEKEKIKTIVNLLKLQFEEQIDIFSTEEHPIAINQPPTVSEVTSKDFESQY